MSESVKETIKLFLDKGYLINPELIEKSEVNIGFLNKNLEANKTGEILIFNENMMKNLLKRDVNYNEEEQSRIELEGNENNVKVLYSFNKIPFKIEAQDFVMHYKKRYELLNKILRSRTELISPISIKRILQKRDRDKVSTIGMVFEKNYTKNRNLIITIEDNTGSISILINKNKKELYGKCRDIVLDEVIGVKGVNGDKIIFAEDVFFPDIPVNNNFKKSSKEEYLAVISDIHVGSKLFLEKKFSNFIKWLNLETGNSEQKELSKKLKYLFIVGDLVDGLGVYPEQEPQLSIKDIRQQYTILADFLKKIRKDISIIICPGDHDAVRLAEPQPPINKKVAAPLYAIENVIMVSNPALINIGSSDDFEGFNVLMYHGKSYGAYADEIESIRFSGATVSDRTDKIMKFLLTKRHLAPTHGSTLFYPDPDNDDLVINIVPDFFVCGHIHKANITQYGKVTKIASSCWQSRTAYQIRVGHDPTPGRVPIVNLKTRETKIMKF